MILNLFQLLLILIATFLACLTVYAVYLIDFNNNLFIHVEKIWAKVLLKIGRIKVEVEGTENIKKNKSYIFVANHMSAFDIPVSMAYIPVSIKMIAKKELARIPFFGWAIFLIGSIFIDRQNREKAVKSLDKALDRIKRRNISIMIYPEGTRSPDGEIKIFKKGAFVIAINSGLPVVPVTIYGSRDILPKNSLRIRKGNIKMIIHEPVSSENKTISDRGDFSRQVRDVIVNSFEKIKNT
ncbi:lysophospholipid acyltransferase family protein [candidate division KSB1 bacterium]